MVSTRSGTVVFTRLVARFAVAARRGLPRGFRMNGEAAWEEARFAGRSDRFVRTAAYPDYGDYRETPANARRNTVVVRAGYRAPRPPRP